MALKVPRISQAEILSFHDAHFSPAALVSFATDFLPTTIPDHIPQGTEHDLHDQYQTAGQGWTEAWYDEEEEDDGLGYYSDGVKRTLTDEQIEIFRHSELEALRRAEDKAAKLRHESAELLKIARRSSIDDHNGDEGEISPDDSGPSRAGIPPATAYENKSGSEDGELEDDGPTQQLTEAEAKRLKKKRARQRKKEKNRKFFPGPKPDLRKRTWDVVDAGMDSLDYDGFETADAASSGVASKRRQISYDD